MLVARSNMSEKILLRTRCKDHRGYATKQKDDKGKDGKGKVGKRNKSETRAKKERIRGKKTEKERKKLDSNIF